MLESPLFQLRSGFRFQQLKFSGFRSSQSIFWIGTIVQLFFQNCRFLGRVFSVVLLQCDQFHLESHYCYALNSCTTVDSSEIPNNHLGCIEPVLNNGIHLPTSTGFHAGFLNHQQYKVAPNSSKWSYGAPIK